MTPPKFGAPGQYVRVTRQGQRCKERMRQPENVVELEDVTTSDTESINPTQVEEETSTSAARGSREEFWDPKWYPEP
jgi:hypothetical protein